MSKQFLFWITALGLFLAAGGWITSAYLFDKSEPITQPDVVASTTTENIISTTNKDVAPRQKYTGQKLDYLGDYKILEKYPKEFVESNRNRLLSLVEAVTKNPDQIDNWIDIGLVKKNVDNYVGAKDVWDHTNKINPNYGLNYFNLGNLYALYLRDFKKAESNYYKALRLDRNSVNFHLGLAEFYRDFYKEKYDLVDDVLLEGLVYVPKDANLLLNLALYYRDTGEKAEAIKYFEKFLTAEGFSDTQAEAVKQEIEKLRQ